MKTRLCFLLLFVASLDAVAQMTLHDRAIVAQQERMVFKSWDDNKFYPKPNRILGVPTNPLWYLTWALHPNYPKTDRRPLSAAGMQTQRLALASAMQITSDYYNREADTVGLIAASHISRISGALSSLDPLYQLYYKKELAPLDNIEEGVFDNVPLEVQRHLEESGALKTHLDQMSVLAERYQTAKRLDMERGQRILMYHRILQEMKASLQAWEKNIYLTQKTVFLQHILSKSSNDEAAAISWTEENDLEDMDEIIRNRTAIQ